MPEGADHRPRRIYLTEGSNLVGVDPQTGRVKATASGSAVNGAAGVYVVRNGVALGLDQGGSGDAWGYDLAVQRVTLAAPGLPWPHYFVDLSGVGGSADPASNLVIIAACQQLAPAPVTQPASAPAGHVRRVGHVRPAGHVGTAIRRGRRRHRRRPLPPSRPRPLRLRRAPAGTSAHPPRPGPKDPGLPATPSWSPSTCSTCL